jgi:hypothetical protein
VCYYLQKNLRKLRILLLLPLLISQLMFWSAIDHYHAVNSYYDQNDPRHSFTQVNLARMKAAKHVAPLTVRLCTADFVPDHTPVSSLLQCPEPSAATTSHHIVSYPNRASPT